LNHSIVARNIPFFDGRNFEFMVDCICVLTCFYP
jgi:hypothetical protein